MKEPITIQLPNYKSLSILETRSGDLLMVINELEDDPKAVLTSKEILHITIPIGHREVLAAHIKP